MRFSSWRWADLSGNGREDLVLIWRGDLAHPELDQLVVLESQPDGTMRPILQRLLSARRAVRSTMKLEALADFTRDGLEEVLLWDATFERASIITAGAGGGIGEYQWSVPCQGSLAAVDQDGDGVHEVVGNQCESGNRISYSWDAEGFIPVTNSE
jgi:hypothetical protein